MLLKLVTPERILFEEEASSVTLPTMEGEITVLPHHADLVAALKPGVAVLTRPDGSVEDIAVSGGFIRVGADTITVLADTAERGDELTLETIREAQERARKLMQETQNVNDVAYAQAAAAMERELARHRAAMRHRHRKGLSSD